MKQIITRNDFHKAFKELRPHNFSYEGLNILFDYLEELEEDTGQEIELDVITICTEYTEYDSLEDFQEDYGKNYRNLDDIRYHTTVITIDKDSFIIQVF